MGIILINGLVQPYPHIFDTAVEAIISVDVLVLLLIHSTNSIKDTLKESSSKLEQPLDSSCSASNQSRSTLAWLLLPFYYLPLVAAVVAMVLWVSKGVW